GRGTLRRCRGGPALAAGRPRGTGADDRTRRQRRSGNFLSGAGAGRRRHRVPAHGGCVPATIASRDRTAGTAPPAAAAGPAAGGRKWADRGSRGDAAGPRQCARAARNSDGTDGGQGDRLRAAAPGAALGASGAVLSRVVVSLASGRGDAGIPGSSGRTT